MEKTNLADLGVKSESQRDEESGSAPAVDYGRGELKVIEMRENNSILRKLRLTEEWLDKKFGVESTGADRIPESQRKPPSILNVCNHSFMIIPRALTMWRQRCCSYGFPCASHRVT